MLLHPRQALERHGQVIGSQVELRSAQLVEHQLEPELGGLVLDDEQHLVVVRGAAHDMLGAEDLIQVQVGAVGEIDSEV